MIRNNTKKVIKEYFMTNPTARLRVRRIEKILNLSLPSVIRYCKELKVENILQKIKIDNITFYTSNRVTPEYLLEKKLFNLKSITNSNLIEHIKQKLSNPTIILFGSYANGQDIENSDIDIFIEIHSKQKLNLTKYEKILERKIQLFQFSNIKKINNKHLANNIINGIRLNGQLEVFK